MCVHASLRQNGFNRKGLQVERCLTSPLTAQVSVCAHVVKEVCCSSSHQVANVLEFQLQDQSFQ